MKETAFFMVFVEGGSAPNFKHRTEDQAEEEAKRLSKMTGKKVYTLCTLKSIQINEFAVADARPDGNELPF